MTNQALRRSFIALHLTLAVVILVEGGRTALHALLEHTPPDLHLGLLGSAQAVAALLFLWPRTLRIGGGALVAIFVVAMVAHGVQGEFPGEAAVYAAAAPFVSVHGSAWGAHPARVTG